MGVEFLLEIGCEEIPARFIEKALDDLGRLVCGFFDESDITYGKVAKAGTPRRLALSVADVLPGQDDKVITRTGPAKQVAYDKEGNPTKAAIGFAKGQGVEVGDLKIVATDKGEYISMEKKVIGRATMDLLAEKLPEIIQSMPWPKSMKWGTRKTRFVRPVHWLLTVLGCEVVDFSLFNLKSGNKTYGHRFLSPGPVEVSGFSDYLNALRGSNVIALIDERKDIVINELERIGKEAGGAVEKDPWLINHVVNLVEYPVALVGTFPEKYLELPAEVLITSMRDHQKYFVVKDENGALLPRFVTISNMLVPNSSVVVKGNERVLVARLEDARFYFEEDLKKPLDKMAVKLSGVLYQADLGTYAEKTERVRKIAARLAKNLAPNHAADIDRAARLAKADLVSGVVGEFPELQGIMGMHYADRQGENPEVGKAIYEHYLPKGLGADLPETVTGAVVALADKFDSICGCFGVGLAPTGSGDPFALRRAALGVIYILDEKQWRLDLPDIIKFCIDLVKDKIKIKFPNMPMKESEEKILEFFKQRLANNLKGREGDRRQYVKMEGTPINLIELANEGKSLPANAIEAVLSARFDDIFDATNRIEALSAFVLTDGFEPFAAAFKRVANILAGTNEDFSSVVVDKALFDSDTEGALFTAIIGVEKEVDRLVEIGDHLGALTTISKIRPQVDKFFDDVLVMHGDEKIRINRLALLGRLGAMFADIADFKAL